MTDTYREKLLASVQDMQSEQLTRQLRTMTDEELDNAICDGLEVPRGTQFTDEQLEMLIESHKMQLQALND
jgi:hypothetical protein